MPAPYWLSTGKWQILTTYRIKTSELIAAKFGRITSKSGHPKPNLVQIHPLCVSGKWVKHSVFVSFLCLNVFFTCLQVKHVIIIINNVLIKVTLMSKTLQGHHTKLDNRKQTKRMDFHVQQLKKCQIMQGCAKNNADVHNWQGLSDGSIPKKMTSPTYFCNCWSQWLQIWYSLGFMEKLIKNNY